MHNFFFSDLRVKMEPSNSCEEVHSNAMSYKEMSADKAPDIVQVGSMWDTGSAVKPLSHKGSATPDGKYFFGLIELAQSQLFVPISEN